MDAPWQVSIINNSSLYLKETKRLLIHLYLNTIYTLCFLVTRAAAQNLRNRTSPWSVLGRVCPKQSIWAALTAGSWKQKLELCFLNANSHTILWMTESITAAGKQGLSVKTSKNMFRIFNIECLHNAYFLPPLLPHLFKGISKFYICDFFRILKF